MPLERITMPQLGESDTEGTISTWLVKEGDHVTKYDPIAEVMTDKVNAGIPSSFNGTNKEVVVKENETVAVGTLICYIEVEGSTEVKKEEGEVEKVQTEDASNQDKSMKKRYSPAVLKLAQE